MKKQANGRNFSPSMSLAEFAGNNDLEVEELTKLIACTDTIKSQFNRYGTDYYHITDLNHWLKVNALRVTANARI